MIRDQSRIEEYINNPLYYGVESVYVSMDKEERRKMFTMSMEHIILHIEDMILKYGTERQIADHKRTQDNSGLRKKLYGI